MLIQVPDSGRSSSDRFIPRRANANFDLSYYYIRNSNENNNISIPNCTDWFVNTAKYYYNLEQYRSGLWKAMMPDNNRILTFSSPKTRIKSRKTLSHDRQLWPVYPRSRPMLEPPSVTLDMPDMDTDVYHQVVDWGKKGYIGTIFENEVHLWHPEDNRGRHVTDTLGRVQHCIKWNLDGTRIATALDSSFVGIWDCISNKTNIMSCTCPYECTVTAIAWTSNCLITGCSKGRLCCWSHSLKHKKTICSAHIDFIVSIQVSCSENYIVTTGIDNTRIWKWPSLQEHFEITMSTIPVKCVAWHPWRDSVLAIGGSTGITLWNVSTCKPLESKPHIHENSHIDSLTFNPLSGEMVVSYYTYDDNDNGVHFLSVLKDLEHIVDEAQFHNGRVPYLMWNADGTKLATAGADENLCIWDFFGTSSDTGKKYLRLMKKKELSTDMFKNLNIFNSCIR